MNVEYILSHKEKSKKFADVILTITDGESSCLAVAEQSIYFLTGKVARNVNVFWGKFVRAEKMYKGESADCKNFTISAQEASAYFDWHIISDYFGMRCESAYDYLKDFYQEDSEFLVNLDYYVRKYGKIEFTFTA